jgi:hypothetical protein
MTKSEVETYVRRGDDAFVPVKKRMTLEITEG